MAQETEHEARIAHLLELDSTLKHWFELVGAFTKDECARTALFGLTASETQEFLELNVIVRAERDTRRDRERYFELRKRHEAAQHQLRAKPAGDGL